MSGHAIHPLVLSGYGLVEAPFENTTDRFGQARSPASRIRVEAITSRFDEALEHLSIRTHPATRLVVVEHGPWSAILTNEREGSDFSNHQSVAASSMSVRTIRVVDSEARWWGRGNLRERLAYEARIFELNAADDSMIRSIACADDGGRWVFETFGEPLPIEASFSYGAARKKDRFTKENLRDLLISIGTGPMTGETFLGARRFALLADELTDGLSREQARASACSNEEADDPALGYFRRGLTRVPHMATHATSVIADFERAIRINPEYEPLVREHLRRAHRILRG
jgi:hypothetical protein